MVNANGRPLRTCRECLHPRSKCRCFGSVRPLRDVVRETILAAVTELGSGRHAARALRISYATMYEHLKKYRAEATR